MLLRCLSTKLWKILLQRITISLSLLTSFETSHTTSATRDQRHCYTTATTSTTTPMVVAFQISLSVLWFGSIKSVATFNKIKRIGAIQALSMNNTNTIPIRGKIIHSVVRSDAFYCTTVRGLCVLRMMWDTVSARSSSTRHHFFKCLVRLVKWGETLVHQNTSDSTQDGHCPGSTMVNHRFARGVWWD